MIPSLSFLLFFSFTALQLHLFVIRTANASLIEDTCKVVANRNANVNYQYCVKSFKNNPTSGKLDDAQGLGELAGLMTIKIIYDGTTEIHKLASKKQDAGTAACLRICDKQFSYVMQHTLQAMFFINAREDDSAVRFLIQAVEEINKCDEAFLQAGRPSPLTQEVRNYVALSTISMVILKMVKK